VLTDHARPELFQDRPHVLRRDGDAAFRRLGCAGISDHPLVEEDRAAHARRGRRIIMSKDDDDIIGLIVPREAFMTGMARQMDRAVIGRVSRGIAPAVALANPAPWDARCVVLRYATGAEQCGADGPFADRAGAIAFALICGGDEAALANDAGAGPVTDGEPSGCAIDADQRLAQS
jgi:hypothetical protein